jgi:hypothetical protein
LGGFIVLVFLKSREGYDVADSAEGETGCCSDSGIGMVE